MWDLYLNLGHLEAHEMTQSFGKKCTRRLLRADLGALVQEPWSRMSACRREPSSSLPLPWWQRDPFRFSVVFQKGARLRPWKKQGKHVCALCTYGWNCEITIWKPKESSTSTVQGQFCNFESLQPECGSPGACNEHAVNAGRAVKLRYRNWSHVVGWYENLKCGQRFLSLTVLKLLRAEVRRKAEHLCRVDAGPVPGPWTEQVFNFFVSKHIAIFLIRNPKGQRQTCLISVQLTSCLSALGDRCAEVRFLDSSSDIQRANKNMRKHAPRQCCGNIHLYMFQFSVLRQVDKVNTVYCPTRCLGTHFSSDEACTCSCVQRSIFSRFSRPGMSAELSENGTSEKCGFSVRTKFQHK